MVKVILFIIASILSHSDFLGESWRGWWLSLAHIHGLTMIGGLLLVWAVGSQCWVSFLW